MTRKMIPLSAGWLSGLFLAFYLCVSGPLGLGGAAVLCAASGLLCAVAIFSRLRFRARAAVFFCAFAAAVAYSSAYTAMKLLPLEALDGAETVITGRVLDFTSGDRPAVTVKGSVGGIGTKALVYIRDFNGGCGDEVSVRARASALSDSDFFRSREYYLPDGITITASASEAEITPSDGSLSAILRGYSRKVSQNIRRQVSGEAGELLAATVTGDRTAFSDGLRLKLNRAGAGHIAAVSGLHVSAAALAAAVLMRKLRAPRLLRAVLTEAAVVAFVIFSGLRVSAIRAGIMMSVAIISSVALRRTDTLNTLCLCGFLMTLANPYAAADSSLLLSLAGVFGVGVAAPAVWREFDIRGRILRAVTASACASLATAPFCMLFFDELSVAAPLTNLFAVPLCTLAVVLGMVFALSGCAFVWPIKLAGILCRAVIFLCGAISKLPFAYIPLGIRPVAVSAAIFAAMTVFLALITKDIRKPAKFAVFSAAAVMAIYGVIGIATGNDVVITALSRADSHSAVLRKGAECIIIDFDGSAEGIDRVLERSGVRRVSFAAILENGASAYSGYSSLSVRPDNIFLFGDEYVFGGAIPVGNIGEGTKIEALGLDIEFFGGGARVSSGGRSVVISQDGEGDISLLDGLTVFGKGEKVFKGDVIREIRLEEIGSGG